MLEIVIVLSIFVTLLVISNFFLWVELKALKNSTHHVQFINTPKGDFERFTEELKEQLSKEPYDNLT